MPNHGKAISQLREMSAQLDTYFRPPRKCDRRPESERRSRDPIGGDKGIRSQRSNFSCPVTQVVSTGRCNAI